MLKSAQFNILIRGIIFAALAVFCFASPIGTLVSLAWVLGTILILAGIVTFLIGRRPNGKFDTSHMVLAMLMVGVGITLIIHPAIISMLIGVFLIFEGIDLCVQAFRYRKARLTHWWWLFVCSLLVMGMGIWAALIPAAGGALLSIVFGIGCTLIAIESFMALKGLKKVETFFRQSFDQSINDSDFAEAEVVE